MAEAESEEVVRLRNKTSEMLKSPSSIALPSSEDPKSSYSLSKSLEKMLIADPVVDEEPKSSYILTKSLAKMVDEDPIRLQNQSCAIRKETVKIRNPKEPVYSSLARLPTFSIGLSSTRGEEPPRASLRESGVDLKDQSPLHYFQMPELGARVFVGNVNGFDTVICRLLDVDYHALNLDLDSELAAVRSIYKGDCPSEFSGGMAQLAEFWGSERYFNVVLSGTELFDALTANALLIVGNLGGKSSKVSDSSSDYEDCAGDETIRQPSDVGEQPGDHVPRVRYLMPEYWETDEGPNLLRLPGSYLKNPVFTKLDDLKLIDFLGGRALQLTQFDDFIILCNGYFFKHDEAIDIVRKNASETADVIATQLVKGALKRWYFLSHPITVIVIFLDHREILQKEKEHMARKDIVASSGLLELQAISQSIVLRDDKEIAESKEEGKVFILEMEENKGIMMEDQKVKTTLVGEPLPNVPQISNASLEEYELGMKSTAISSKLTSAEVQDNSEASSSLVLIKDNDCKSEDFMVSCLITKWIIYGDLRERTILCFFNVEEKEYEFYFEDHESMATIIGLGLPHSKVVLKEGSPHVTVVEIPKEDWNVVWAHSKDISLSIPEGNILKQEIFPDILHCIANVINTNNIVSKANDGGGRGNNGKDKLHDNADNAKGKGKAHDHDNHENIGHPDGGSNGAPDDNDNKGREGKDGNDDKKDGRDQDDGKTSNDGKKIQAKVHLHLWPGGVLKEKGKKKEFGEEGEEKIIELEEVHEGVEKKKKKYLPTLWQALTRSENGNVVGNQQKSTTTSGDENGDDESLLKQLKEQIHAEMVFTFTIKEEVRGQLKTIQATIDPITFQFPSKNKKNYLKRRRFGWFHEKLKVVFGVVNPKVAYLNAKSCKVLDSSEVEELNSQSSSKGNSRTSTNAYKGKIGVKYAIIASSEYNRTNGSEAKTTDEVHNSSKTNKRVTKGDFSISDCINLNSQQLKYSYHPRSPFKEKEFEELGEVDRSDMYHLNPICQPQQVSCEGTWHPYGSKSLEAYKLEASRELRMTRIYNPKQEIVEEKKQKGVWKVEKNLPLCFIQKLEKVVYLNHSMLHLTFSTTGAYHLREIDDPSNSSTFLTQGHCNEEPKWPSNDPLIDVKQKKNI